MTREDTKNFLKRIKQHYQEFIVDNYKVEEWYKELKDYNYDEVNQKLEEHLKSEQYGNQIPKVYFLTKYLTKEQDKGKIDNTIIYCRNCNKRMYLRDADKHYDRCNSIVFLMSNAKKYFNKDLNREKLEQADIETFDKYYISFCEKLFDVIDETSPMKKSLENYILTYYDQKPKYELDEVLS